MHCIPSEMVINMFNTNAGNNFDEYAYRIATKQLAAPATYLEEGSWVTLDTSGKIVSADGTKLAFLCLTSNRVARDNITPQNLTPKMTYLLGGFERTVYNSDIGNTTFDAAQTYAYMTPLRVTKDATTGQGIVTPWVKETYTVDSVTHAVTVSGYTADKIVAYALGPVDVSTGSLRIMSR